MRELVGPLPCTIEQSANLPPASRLVDLGNQWGGDMTQDPANLLIRQPYPDGDDELASLPGYLGSKRIDRPASPGTGSPPLDVRPTAPPARPLIILPGKA
ncbi:MAG TPA: hypothetical protein PLS53_15780 [Thermoanaerobaculaceae bacterium]|nr:hypothetical protein [Thermoanaerobaculaceae bacterium]HPS79621.1 hypothetical protein [Thermoanaerobaculaceae bacterium]